MAEQIENPTDSETWTVLEHRDGGLEVWDCEAFGPWKLVAGPFDSWAEAARELQGIRREWRLARERREEVTP